MGSINSIGIIESELLWLENPSEIIRSGRPPALPGPPLARVPGCRVHAAFKPLQGWGIPWATLPVSDHLLS